jgi:hypothetical protein
MRQELIPRPLRSQLALPSSFVFFLVRRSLEESQPRRTFVSFLPTLLPSHSGNRSAGNDKRFRTSGIRDAERSGLPTALKEPGQNRMGKKLISAMLLILAAGIAQGDNKPRRPAAISSVAPPKLTTAIASFTVSPASITFNATDPDFPTVAGSSAGTATLSITGGASGRSWTMSLQASGTTFTGCATVPASAVTVTCTSATDTNTGGSTGTAICSAPFALSTTSTQFAGGKEGTVSDRYDVTLSFTLTDSWRYIAATTPTCPITLTYTADAP